MYIMVYQQVSGTYVSLDSYMVSHWLFFLPLSAWILALRYSVKPLAGAALLINQ